MKKEAKTKKHPAKRRHTRARKQGLEAYAFWTGLASTLISLIHVIIIALK